MKRCRAFMHLLGLLLLGCPFPAALAAEKNAPNIVIFLPDDQGWGDLGCYGHPLIQSPHLDEFASQGVRFTQAYAASAFCSPSRSAILTGRTPYRNGVFTWIPENSQLHLRKWEITIAELLQAKGYATCHAGKWHLNGSVANPTNVQPDAHGFDHWFATQNNASPNHMNPENYVRNGEPVGKLEGPSALLVAEEAIRWLKESRPRDKPFFLNLWTHEPHLPIESDPRFLEMYEFLEPEVAQHHANVTQLDFAFGMVMQALEALGEVENTFVIFTSDNGPEGDGTRGRTRGSTGGLRGRKRDMYEGGIRVPALLRWPGHIKPGTTCDEPIIGSDIFSTIASIAGAPIPADRVIDGVNFLPALAEEKLVREHPLYWRCNIAYDDMEIALRIGDWKLISNHSLLRFELYNIARDPHETRDLQLREPEVMEQMGRAWFKQQEDLRVDGWHWPGLEPWDWNVRLQRRMFPPTRK